MAKERRRRSPERDATAQAFVDMELVDGKGWKRKRPAWVEKEGFIFVGAWEPLMEFRHAGITRHDDEKIWEFAHSEEFIRDVKRLGCNCLIAHFDFSFGKSAQADEWEDTRKQIALCRKHGLKVGVYFRIDWIIPDALAEDETDILKHTQRDPWGRPQLRKPHRGRYLCFHHPEAVRCREDVIRFAIEELKVDIMHFDGFHFVGWEPAGTCRCEKCKEDFRRFLKERYAGIPDIAKKRFAFSRFDTIEPPHTYPDLTFPGTPVVDPLWQAWTEFRCHWTAKLTKHFAEYVHRLNPEVAVEVNTAVAVRENVAACLGVDLPTVARYTDALWCEDAYPPEILPSGELISRIRQFKMARTLDNVLFTYMHGADDRAVLRNMAHAAAFNGGTLGSLGFVPHMPWSYRNSYDVKQTFVKWLRRNWEYYEGTGQAADIALWRSERSAAFGSDRVAAASMRMEQLLIEERMPFTIVFDEWLKACGPERILVLANAECVIEPQAEAIERFVKKGGGLFIGQESGLYDGWRRRRDDFIFRTSMGSAAARDAELKPGVFFAIGPAGAVTGWEERRRGGKSSLGTHGKGRVAYVPEIVAPSECPPLITPEGQFDMALDYTHWRAPTKKEEVLEGLRWLAGKGLRFEVAAPRGVVAEYLFQKKHKRYLVHVINFLEQGDVPLVQVRMRLGPRQKVRTVKVISPDPGGPPKLEWKKNRAELYIEIFKLDLYAVVIIET
jgi:hypothetical protein